MNMMVFRYGTQMIVVDSGLMFPDEELLGIDVIVPDISFLIENASQVKAIVLTHGHEDHIGALPFVFPALSHVPIYGTRYTLGLASAKLAEHQLLDQAELITVEAGQIEEMGDFQVEFIHVTHSIVDAVMLAITTPAGVILHTGDFKIDSSPLDGQVTDLPGSRSTGVGASWLCSPTVPTWTDPDSPHRKPPSSRSWTRFFIMLQARSLSPVSPPPSIAFKPLSTWRSATVAR